jgi:MraZ protein
VAPFRGTYDYSLDAKNRLTVPAKFRSSLSGHLVLAQGLKPCVAIWTREAFDQQTEAALRDFHPLAEDAEAISYFYFASAFDAELDGAGRVMIPAALMEYASLEKEVVVVGARDRLEVWDRATWGEFSAALPGRVGGIRSSLSHAR